MENKTEIKNPRVVKFEILVKKIRDAYCGHDYDNNSFLNLIFDFESMNDYAKLIEKYGGFFWSKDVCGMPDFFKKLNMKSEYQDLDKKITNTTDFVEKINNWQWKLHNDRKEHFRFIFLSLMVLAVDDTNKEQYLSAVCDFARMLEITDDEMKDVVNVVKYVLQDETFEQPTNEEVKKYFGSVLRIYEH